MSVRDNYKNYIIAFLVVIILFQMILLMYLNYGKYCTPVSHEINIKGISVDSSGMLIRDPDSLDNK